MVNQLWISAASSNRARNGTFLWHQYQYFLLYKINTFEGCGIIIKLQFIMRFIHYIYKYTPTYRLIFPSYPTRETKDQIGMALVLS